MRTLIKFVLVALSLAVGSAGALPGGDCGPIMAHASWESMVDHARIGAELKPLFVHSTARVVTAYAVPPIDVPHTLAVVAAVPGGAGVVGAFDPKSLDTLVVIHETTPAPIISVFIFPERKSDPVRRVVGPLYPGDGEDSDALRRLVPAAFEDDEFDVEAVLDVLTGSMTSVSIK